VLKKKSLCPALLFLLALSPLSSIYAGGYNASIILEGSNSIPLKAQETEEIPLVSLHDIERKPLNSFHISIHDAMIKGRTPLFTNHDNIRTQADKENLTRWEGVTGKLFSPASSPLGQISGDTIMFVRTLEDLEYYKKYPYYGGDPAEYCSRMPYISTSLFRISDAEFYTQGGSRSTGFILNVPTNNILCAAGSDLDSGKAENYLAEHYYKIIENVERLLCMGVDSPDDCLSGKPSQKHKSLYQFSHNEIVIQPSISNGPSCSIDGAFVLENSPDFSDWKFQSQEFYNWAKDKGLTIVRFAELPELTQNWLKKELNFPNEKQITCLKKIWEMTPNHVSRLFDQVATSQWLNNRLSAPSENEKKLLRVVGKHGKDTVERLLQQLLTTKTPSEQVFKEWIQFLGFSEIQDSREFMQTLSAPLYPEQ